jgi:hypothetical protein
MKISLKRRRRPKNGRIMKRSRELKRSDEITKEQSERGSEGKTTKESPGMYQEQSAKLVVKIEDVLKLKASREGARRDQRLSPEKLGRKQRGRGAK